MQIILELWVFLSPRAHTHSLFFVHLLQNHDSTIYNFSLWSGSESFPFLRSLKYFCALCFPCCHHYEEIQQFLWSNSTMALLRNSTWQICHEFVLSSSYKEVKHPIITYKSLSSPIISTFRTAVSKTICNWGPSPSLQIIPEYLTETAGVALL